MKTFVVRHYRPKAYWYVLERGLVMRKDCTLKGVLDLLRIELRWELQK
jgi:hypothetical protein